MRELIDALASAGAIQTIVSGNVRANADIKLAAFGLVASMDLDVGGYGSDSKDRSELVKLAKDRAARKYGGGAGFDAVVIGDTPRDVEAAREGGARILAVASGVHPVYELRAAGATTVLPDLSDTDTAFDYVLNLDL